MTLKGNKDLWSGIGLGAFGMFVAVESLKLPYTSEFGPGPGFYPLWIGFGLIFLSVILLVTTISFPTGQEDRGRCSPLEVGRALTGWAGLMSAILLLPRLGFPLSLALLTFFLILVLERRSVWVAIGVGLGLALGFYAIFSLALGLSLPSGSWGF